MARGADTVSQILYGSTPRKNTPLISNWRQRKCDLNADTLNVGAGLFLGYLDWDGTSSWAVSSVDTGGWRGGFKLKWREQRNGRRVLYGRKGRGRVAELIKCSRRSSDKLFCDTEECGIQSPADDPSLIEVILRDGRVLSLPALSDGNGNHGVLAPMHAIEEAVREACEWKYHPDPALLAYKPGSQQLEGVILLD